MTKTLSLRSFDVPSFSKFGIGFESMFDELLRTSDLQSNTSYPPYNIIKTNENCFTIELAVAGFKEGEIEIKLEKNQLTIAGAQIKPEQDVEYIVHGISARPFSRVFSLAEHVLVIGATIVDGMLKISLERKIPDEQKPRNILIQYTK